MDDSSSALHSNSGFLTVNELDKRKMISKCRVRGSTTAAVERDVDLNRFRAGPRMVIAAVAAMFKAVYSGFLYCVPMDGDEVNEEGWFACCLLKPLFDHFLPSRYGFLSLSAYRSDVIFCHYIICIYRNVPSGARAIKWGRLAGKWQAIACAGILVNSYIAATPTTAPSASPTRGSLGMYDAPLSTFVSSNQVGFVARGAAADDQSGGSVAMIGDMNGDGFDDMAIGAAGQDKAGNTDSGAVYVLFGHATGFGAVDLMSVMGTGSSGGTGFAIYGEFADGGLGWSVGSAGDVNGDGKKDLIVGAASATVGTIATCGAAYVIFGQTVFNDVYLSNYFSSGVNRGFKIYGKVAGMLAGFSVSKAGDFNKDTYGDILIGAPQASYLGYQGGAAYLIFGKASGFGDIDLSNLGSSSYGGIRFWATENTYPSVEVAEAGAAVSSAGDFNGDGFGDIVIGAPTSNYGSRVHCGAAYVIFGHSVSTPTTFTDTALDSLVASATTGFRVAGATGGARLGASVAKGNFNGDALSDVLLGAPNGYGTNGQVTVLWGRNFGSWNHVDLGNFATGSLGFRIWGAALGDALGTSVANAGDFSWRALCGG
jgi:hypothetical protein